MYIYWKERFLAAYALHSMQNMSHISKWKYSNTNDPFLLVVIHITTAQMNMDF
jgi:hypothetical protein